MRAARVVGGIVVDLWDVSDPAAYGDVELIAASDECGLGWSYADGVFSPPPVPLADLRLRQIVHIETARDAACAVPVFVHGRSWQAGPDSRALLGQSITLAQAGLPLPAVWRDAENNNMPVTALADLLAIAGAIAVNVQAAYAYSWSLKTGLDMATTAEEVAEWVW